MTAAAERAALDPRWTSGGQGPPTDGHRRRAHRDEFFSLHPPNIPEKRSGSLQFSGEALAIRGGDLKLAQSYRRHLRVVFKLDRRGDALACVVVLRVQPLLRHR